VVDTYGAKPKVKEMVALAPPPGGGGGGRKYEMFTPSHPQAVNQFVRDYNYKANQNGYKKDLERYKQSLTRTHNNNNNNNNNSNNYDNVCGAIIMTKDIAKVHPVHLMNAD